MYGVAVPGTEGRAGMAAIVMKDELDLEGLRAIGAAVYRPMRGRCSCVSAEAET